MAGAKAATKAPTEAQALSSSMPVYAERQAQGGAPAVPESTLTVQAPALLPIEAFKVAGLEKIVPFKTYKHPTLGQVEALEMKTLYAQDPALAQRTVDALYPGYVAQFPDPAEHFSKADLTDLYVTDPDSATSLVLLKTGDALVGAAHLTVPPGAGAKHPYIDWGYKLPISKLKGIGGLVDDAAKDFALTSNPATKAMWIEVNDPKMTTVDSMPPEKRNEFWGREGFRKLDVAYEQAPITPEFEPLPLQLGVKPVAEHPMNGLDKQSGLFFENGVATGVTPEAALDSVRGHFATWVDVETDVAFQRAKVAFARRAEENGGLIPLIDFTAPRTVY
jgi:hypothetical protein